MPVEKEKQKENAGRGKLIAALVSIAVVTLLVYANSLGNAFLYDDDGLVVNNPYLRSWRYLGIFFTTTIFRGVGISSNFYRPLQMVTYLADYSLWQLNPLGYHLTNISLHIFTAVLVCLLVHSITKSLSVAFFTGLLFAVHPIHTEAITYIAGRADPLGGLFLLLSLLFYMRSGLSRPGGRSLFSYCVSLLFFGLALLSRETTLIFPLIIILYDRCFARQGRREGNVGRFWLGYLGFFLVLAAYAGWRLTVIEFVSNPTLLSETSFYLRLATTAKAVVICLGLLFLPLNLRMERSIPLAASVFEPSIFLSLLLVLLILAVTVKLRKRSPTIFFFLSWFFLNLMPVSNIFPINATVAEHWLYLPSIGIFAILAMGMTRLIYFRRRIAILIIVSLLLFYAFLTVRQNTYWRDDVSFYERTLRYSPGSLRVYKNLAYAYQKRGEYEKAVALYKKILRMKPGYAPAHADLGAVYYNMGKYEEAIAEEEKALEFEPDLYKAFETLGAIFLKEGEYARAEEAYGKALRINPDSARSHYELASTYNRKGEYEAALREYETVLRINSAHAGAYVALANDHLKQGLFEEAAIKFRRALEIEPELAEAHYGLARAHDERGRLEEALREYRKVVEIKPDRVEAWSYIAAIYQKQGLYGRAEEELKRALKDNPQSAVIHTNLGTIYLTRGKSDLAMEEYRKALTIEPDEPGALNALGYLYIDKGIDLDEGIRLAERALGLQPENAAFMDSLGWAYYKKGRFDEAIVLLEQAVRKGGEKPVVCEHLARAYEGKGRHNDARKMWQKILQVDPGNVEAQKAQKEVDRGIRF